jgi:choline-phosphate cytidylyltransferase
MTPRGSGAKSPLAIDRLNPMDAAVGGGTPGGSAASINQKQSNKDFAAGYAMGLIGGVKGWMQGSNRRNLSDSRAPSPSNSGEDDTPEAKSPVEQTARGRRGRPAADVDVEMIKDAPSAQLAAETKEASVGRL